MKLTGDAFIYVARTTDPYKVWSELSNKYKPKDNMDICNIKENFTKCKIKNALENLSLRMKRLMNTNKRLCEIDSNDLKVHVKANLLKRIY